MEYLGVLYHRYMHLVYGVALKYLKDPDLSKDVVMQIFEVLVEKLPYHQVTNFKSWLYVVSKNHCLGMLRKKPPVESIDHIFMETQEKLHLNGEDREGNEVDLTVALSSLTSHQRRCIQMFYYEKKSYQEIASETGYSQNKVKSYIQNGKRNLKIYLDKNEPE